MSGYATPSSLRINPQLSKWFVAPRLSAPRPVPEGREQKERRREGKRGEERTGRGRERRRGIRKGIRR